MTLLKHLYKWAKINYAANESADQKTKEIIRDIIDPTPGLFIDGKLNPNEQNLKNEADKVFNLPTQVQQQLNETVFKKIIKQPIIQPTPLKIIPNVVPKTETSLSMMMNLIHLRRLNQRQ